MRETNREQIRRALDECLSGMDGRPSLEKRVLARAKGERRGPRRLSLALAVALLMLLLAAAALAAGCFLLLTTLHAGLFVMLTLANLSQNAGTSALPLKPLERALQGFVLTNTYLGHCYPSPRSSRLDISRLDGRMANRIVIISPLCLSVNR